MNENYIPQRGIDFDDFVGSTYFAKSLKMRDPQLRFVYCKANDKHDDDYIGISLRGYADTDAGSLLKDKPIYPAKNLTKQDMERIFEKVELENGDVSYTQRKDLSIDEVFIRVCYKTPGQPNPEKDNIKWVAAVDGGEAVVLHGDRRVYTPKDAEQ